MDIKHLKIKNKYDCTGCRACEQVCPVKCIKMIEDEEGFLYPEVDEKKCINCGLCKNICPQIKRKHRRTEKDVYAVKAKNSEDARKSTSAGVAYILSKNVLEKNGVVIGCAYNNELEPIQLKVDDIEDLQKLRGSKYVSSNTLNTFQETKKILDEGKRVLYIGTPCQIGGLYAYLRKDYDNLITVDIVCHGVPSVRMFKKYIQYLEEKYKNKIINYEFRNKDKVFWGEFCIKITFKDKKIKYLNANDDFYYSNFLAGNTYRECCYKCEYANVDRIGDITLADFWGIEKINSEFFSKEGVSLVMVNTKKGVEVFNQIKELIVYRKHNEEEASRKNRKFKRANKKNSM